MFDGGVRAWTLLGLLPLALVGCPGNSTGTADAGDSIGPSGGSDAGGSSGGGGGDQADASSPDASDGGGSSDGGTGAVPNGSDGGSANGGSSTADGGSANGGAGNSGDASVDSGSDAGNRGGAAGGLGDGGTASDASGGGSGGAATGDVEYRACSVLGGGQTIRLSRFDGAASTCIRLVLDDTGTCPFGEVTSPEPLCLSTALLQRGVSDCNSDEPASVAAIEASGSVSTDQGIGLNLTLTFPTSDDAEQEIAIELARCLPTMLCAEDCRQ